MKKFDLISHPYDDFYNLMNRFFDSNFPAISRSMNDFRVDVQDKENDYVIEADLPGIDKKEIQLNLTDNYLNIHIEKDSEEQREESEQNNYVHRERLYSSMSRTIYLPDASEEGISAKLDNGVLEISVPKMAQREEESKRIEIQ